MKDALVVTLSIVGMLVAYAVAGVGDYEADVSATRLQIRLDCEPVPSGSPQAPAGTRDDGRTRLVAYRPASAALLCAVVE